MIASLLDMENEITIQCKYLKTTTSAIKRNKNKIAFPACGPLEADKAAKRVWNVIVKTNREKCLPD